MTDFFNNIWPWLSGAGVFFFFFYLRPIILDLLRVLGRDLRYFLKWFFNKVSYRSDVEKGGQLIKDADWVNRGISATTYTSDKTVIQHEVHHHHYYSGTKLPIVDEVSGDADDSIPKDEINEDDEKTEDEDPVANQLDIVQKFINDGKHDEAERLLGAIDANRLGKALAYCRLALEGHLRIRQGKIEEGVKLLERAIQRDPESKNALASSVYIKIIQDEYDEAIQLGLNLLKEHPDNDLIAAHVLRGRLLSKDKHEDFLQGIPSSAQHGEEFGQLLLEVKFQNGLNWVEDAETFLKKYPDNLLVKVRLNEDVITKALNRRGGRATVLDRATDLEEKDKLRAASQQLAKIWREKKTTHNAEDFKTIPSNASLGFSMIGDSDSSETLLKEGIKAFPTDLELKLLLANHLDDRNKGDEALKVYESIGDEGTLESKFYFVNSLFQSGETSRAKQIVNELVGLDLHDASISATMCMSLAEPLVDYGDTVTARRLLDLAREKDRDDVRRYALEVKLLRFQQSPKGEIDAVIQEAIDTFKPHPHQEVNTGFAIFLHQEGRKRDALRVLGSVSPLTASQELRLHLELLIECREFEQYEKVRNAVPTDVVEAMSFDALDVNFWINSKQLIKAEPLTKKIAETIPVNFNNAIIYINLLIRLNKDEEALRFIETLPRPSATDDKQSILKMASAYLRFSKAKDALSLIYLAKISFPDDQEVTEAYLNFLLSSELRNSELLKAPETVTPNAAIAVEVEGELKIWVIEPNSELRQTEFYIGPDHGMARQLLGHKLDDQVMDPQTGEPYGKIKWIKTKEVHLMHVLLENFEQLIPDANFIRRVEMDFESDDPLKHMREELQESQKTHQAAWQTYQDKVPLFRFAAQFMLGTIHTFYEEFPRVFEGNLLVCAGTSEERAGAFGTITQNEKRGFVADLLTFWIIHRNDWLPIIRKILGAPYVTQDTKDRLAEYLEQERHSGESAGMIALEDGDLVRIEITQEQQNAARKTDEGFRDFLNRLSVADVLPTPPEQAKKLEEMDRHFFDDASAAQQLNVVFLSEDWGYREFADQSIGCASVWLQPVLQEAYRRNHLDVNAYQRAVCLLLQHRHQFTSIDIDTLLYLEANEDFDFRTHASTAFNFTDEWRPLVALTMQFINIMWAKYEHDVATAKLRTADILEVWRNYPHLEQFEDLCVVLATQTSTEAATTYVNGYIKDKAVKPK